MAIAFYKNGQFRESIHAHSEALETYRRIVGEGENPIMAGYGDLAEAGGALGLDNFDLSSLLGSKGDVEGSDEVQEQEKQNGEPEKPKAKPVVHEDLIDIEKLRESVVNETDGFESEL